MLICIVSMLVFGGVRAADNDWVYTPETHITIAPATAEGLMNGLDAMPRGFDDGFLETVDKWCWTACWSVGRVNFGTLGLSIIIR